MLIVFCCTRNLLWDPANFKFSIVSFNILVLIVLVEDGFTVTVM